MSILQASLSKSKNIGTSMTAVMAAKMDMARQLQGLGDKKVLKAQAKAVVNPPKPKLIMRKS
jgi:hypothetical protein